jgi:acyl-CoA thioesterase I
VPAAFLGAASQLHAQSGSTISIMPLGDSLTWGWDGLSDPSTMDTGGYRSPLYQALTADGINVNYVGVNNENPGPVLTAAGETAQNGFNGYRIDQIAANLAGDDPVSNDNNYGGYWLTGGGGTGRLAETPNIILLQIGTNDLTQGYDLLYIPVPGTTETPQQLASDTATRLGNLISQIMTYEPQATLLVDGAPLMDSPPGALELSQDYDLDVESIISSQFQGKDVYYVDMWDAMADNPIPGNQLFSTANDGVHLNMYGYDVIAQAWENAILQDYDFSDPDPVPEPSTYALFAGGALALFAWRKFRKAS